MGFTALQPMRASARNIAIFTAMASAPFILQPLFDISPRAHAQGMEATQINDTITINFKRNQQRWRVLQSRKDRFTPAGQDSSGNYHFLKPSSREDVIIDLTVSPEFMDVVSSTPAEHRRNLILEQYDRAVAALDTVNTGPITGKRYVLIINSDTNPRHGEKNIVDAARALGANGFSPANMRVVSASDYQLVMGAMTGEGVLAVGVPSEPATHDSVARNLRQLSSIATAKDMVFVYVTGLSDERAAGQERRLSFPDGTSFTTSDFTSSLSRLNAALSVFVFDNCYGEAFTEAVTSNRTDSRIAVSISDSDSAINCVLFSPHFWASLAKQGRYNDRNSDGRTSVLEAFEFAVAQYNERKPAHWPAADTRRLFKTSGRVTDAILVDGIRVTTSAVRNATTEILR